MQTFPSGEVLLVIALQVIFMHLYLFSFAFFPLFSHFPLSFCFFWKQAERQMEEYQSLKAFILAWIEKAEALVTSSIVWSSASQLQEQIRAHQASLNE